MPGSEVGERFPSEILMHFPHFEVSDRDDYSRGEFYQPDGRLPIIALKSCRQLARRFADASDVTATDTDVVCACVEIQFRALAFDTRNGLALVKAGLPSFTMTIVLVTTHNRRDQIMPIFRRVFYHNRSRRSSRRHRRVGRRGYGGFGRC
jgi:hypothetical protein